MKNIVQLTTQDITKAIPVTTTRIVADMFGKRHDNVVRKIDSLMASKESEYFNALKIEVVEYLDNKGELRKEYQLTEEQTMYLIMGFTGKEAGKFKDMFIKQFQLMRKELQARAGTRNIAKKVRHSLTDSISANLEDGTKHKSFAYSNYTKLVYKKVLGMTVKKYKEKHGIPTDGNVRDYLDMETIEKVQDMESKIAVLLEGFTTIMTDKEAYRKIAELL